MAQDGPKMAQHGPKMGPRWPKMAQDGPKMGPRWAQDGSKIGLPRPSNIEADIGSAGVNLKYRFGPILGPSWGPYGAHMGPLGLMFGLILGVLR